ncbi:MAG: hypothetical protein WAU86_04980 [Oricola sp.]
MTKETIPQPFSRARLQDTDAMARDFHAFGKEGIPNWVIALRLGVHVNTVGTFLRRAPKSRAALDSGRAEAGADPAMLEAGLWRPARKPAAPKIGEECPTCGQEYRGEGAIVLTAARLAEARKRFEDLIDRHIAARRAAGNETKAG